LAPPYSIKKASLRVGFFLLLIVDIDVRQELFLEKDAMNISDNLKRCVLLTKRGCGNISKAGHF
jgi:hypothetical protein